MKSLYKDKIFGILNRNGFEFKINKLENDFIVYLLDFKKVGEMNSKFGYLKTNKKFKKTFKKIKKNGYIVGRCFYGDEILIAVPYEGYENIHTVEYLKNNCDKKGLKFRKVCTIHYKQDKISKTIKKLIKKIEKYK